MKLTLFTIVSSALLVASAPFSDVIASRQVDTRSLRFGSRRLTARLTLQSPAPFYQIAKYVNCGPGPDGSYGSTLAGREADSTSDGNTILCFYNGGVVCTYDPMTGAQTSQPNASCKTNLAPAPSSGICYQNCPQKLMGGQPFVEGHFYSYIGTPAVTSCQFASNAQAAMLGIGDIGCNYNALDGTRTSDTTNSACPSTISRSNNCVAISA